jgi:hypothetical protein
MGVSGGYSYSQSNNLELQKKKRPRSDKAPRKREMLRKIGLADASSSMGVLLDGYLALPFLTVSFNLDDAHSKTMLLPSRLRGVSSCDRVPAFIDFYPIMLTFWFPGKNRSADRSAVRRS